MKCISTYNATIIIGNPLKHYYRKNKKDRQKDNSSVCFAEFGFNSNFNAEEIFQVSLYTLFLVRCADIFLFCLL